MLDLTQEMDRDRIAREEGRSYAKKRFLFTKILQDNSKHFLGIIGPRGVGKTVLLKQLLSEYEDGFYISMGDIKGDLFSLIKKLHQEHEKTIFFLDEIYDYKNVNEQIKKIYDFLDIRIIFTSSVAFKMMSASHDFSRQIKLYALPLFSLREYVYFKYSIPLPILSLKQIIDKSWPNEVMEAGVYFDEYLTGDILPYALNKVFSMSLLHDMIQEVIHHDIPKIAPVAVHELAILEELLGFIGQSTIDEINFTSIANHLKITKYKAQQYLSWLEQAFIIQIIYPGGRGVLKEAKVIMALPYRLLYRSYDETLEGFLREDFFAGAMDNTGYQLQYLKSTRGEKTRDYIIENKNTIVFEIAGKGKGRSRFKGIQIKGKIVFTHSFRSQSYFRPLFLAGLLG